MTRWLVAAALALLAACSNEPELKVDKVAPALWQVRDAAGHEGWLFGTIHTLPDGVDWMTPQLEAALTGSGVLVVEIADLADSAAGQKMFTQISTRTGLPPLVQRLAPADRPELAATLDRLGLGESQFARVETWAAALMIANLARTDSSENGVDRALLQRGLPTVSLESFHRQYAMFDQLAEADQLELLRQVAHDTGATAKREQARNWIEGDLAALEKKQDEQLADPELRETLLVARNREWTARITALMSEGKRPLVAVGAGHMLGAEGLPALLAAQGYTVTRLQ